MAGIKIRNLSEEFSFGSVISGVDSDLLADEGVLWHNEAADSDRPHRITVNGREMAAIPGSDFTDNRVLRTGPQLLVDSYKRTFDYLYKFEPMSYIGMSIHSQFGGRPLMIAAFNELLDYFGSLYFERAVRIVVLSGAGRAFCAGLDLKSESGFAADPAIGGPGAGLLRQRRISEIVIRMRRAPQPIIALVQGPACGGGFAFALASDVRIAGRSARMNAAFVKLGLSGCDIGVSYMLPRLVGSSGVVDEDTAMLYDYLKEHNGICASHTSATGMGTDWRDINPQLEPFVEIYQGHRQSYEYLGAPRSARRPGESIGGWQPLGFIWNALAMQYRIGFEASSDHISTHISYAVALAEDTRTLDRRSRIATQPRRNWIVPSFRGHHELERR